MTWADVLPRDERVQLSISGKSGTLRGDAGANDPVFASRKGGGRLTERAVHAMVKVRQRRLP